MYVPVALSQGQRLYFDLWYPYGPLIPYWHSLLFRAFGVHLVWLYACGLGTAFGVMILLYRIARMFLPVSLSLFAGTAFALTALPSHLFNYALPYSYPAAYSTLFFVGILYLLLRDCGSADPTWRLPAAGILAGCTLLTKIETGFAAWGLVVCALLLRAMSGTRARALAGCSLQCLPSLLAAAAVYRWLISAGGWRRMFADNIPLLGDSYWVMHYGKLWAAFVGFTTSPPLLLQSAAKGIGWVVLITALVMASTKWRSVRRLSLGAGCALCLIEVWTQYPWKFAPYLAWISPAFLGRQLPDLVRRGTHLVLYNSGLVWPSLLLLAIAMAAWWRAGRDRSQTPEILLAAASFGYGVRTLVRMYHAGYPIFYCVLAYVAALALVVKLCGRLPFPVPPRVWNGLAAVLATGVLIMMSPMYVRWWRPSPVASARGTVYADATEAAHLNQAIQFLDAARQAHEKVLVLPEESVLYFFSETSALSFWYTALPGLIPRDRIPGYLAGLDRQQPRYVILSNRSTPEYGVPIFGTDYNREIYAWVGRNYRPVKTIGDYQRIADPKVWAAIVYERAP